MNLLFRFPARGFAGIPGGFLPAVILGAVSGMSVMTPIDTHAANICSRSAVNLHSAWLCRSQGLPTSTVRFSLQTKAAIYGKMDVSERSCAFFVRHAQRHFLHSDVGEARWRVGAT